MPAEKEIKKMLSYLIKNAKVYDGTGDKPYMASVGVKGDTIECIIKDGELPEAEKVIDAQGRILTPGFIDIHSHADNNILTFPGADNNILQGITTFVGGNCGHAAAPACKYYAAEKDGDFDSFEEWMQLCDKAGLGANSAPLAGLNNLRSRVMGDDWAREATDEEIEKICDELRKCLDAGAWGLTYMGDPCPSHYASTKEFHAVCNVLEEYKAQFHGHTRHHQNQWPSEDGRTFYGVHNDEKGEITSGRYHGLVQFMELYKAHPKMTAVYAHFTNMFYVPMPHRTETEEAMIQETLDTFINEPAAEGYDVYFNVLVHQHSLSGIKKVVDEFLPSMSNDPVMKEFATAEVLIEKLKDADFREQFAKYVKSGKVKVNYTCPAQDPYWSDCLMFFDAKDKSLLNRTLMDVTKEKYPDATRHDLIYKYVFEVMYDIMIADPNVGWALVKDKREYQGTRKFARNDRCMPMTDSVSFPLGVDKYGVKSSCGIAPLSFTTMVRWLVDQVKADGNITLEDAVYKASGLPAHVMKFNDRGLVKEGMKADLNLIDWEKLDYTIDFNDPSVPATGMDYVFVNGVPALAEGKLTHAGSGRALRRCY